jgi:3-deoxy-D-arabino-heptulosonate 7-phosphate (DAHP) synthase
MRSNEKLIIAGPCALESQEHAHITTTEAKKSGVNVVRMNLWKPRTSPGFEGVGEEGLPWVLDATKQGLGVAMEVMNPEQTELVLEHVLLQNPHASLLLWIGSRNQNHILQRDIASVVAGEDRVRLMIKNQPWSDEAHWKGIVGHVLSGGVTEEQLLLCHRGHAPQDKKNAPMRNIPDIEMALSVKQELNLPLILDPSHIGGVVSLVKSLALEYGREDLIDGQIIEVHPDPVNAMTDSKQQLTWDELRELLPSITKKGK